jgi:hypothetical protein
MADLFYLLIANISRIFFKNAASGRQRTAAQEEKNRRQPPFDEPPLISTANRGGKLVRLCRRRRLSLSS